MLILKIFAVIATLFAAYIAYWLYQDQRAESAANAFRATIAVGGNVQEAAARAQSSGIRESGGKEAHIFFFQGPIFNAHLCEVKVADGKVLEKNVSKAGD